MKTNYDNRFNGTSFFFTIIRATVEEITSVLGEPIHSSNDGEDKTNFEWVGETSNGEVFTVYDWKEYRRLKKTEMIDWHIGGHDKISTVNAKHELLEKIR